MKEKVLKELETFEEKRKIGENKSLKKKEKKNNKLDADWTYLMMKISQREKTKT